MITISADPRTVDFWGQSTTLWLPVVDGDGEYVELGLVGSHRDALFMANNFRRIVELRGWTVAKDMERRANAPSPVSHYREAIS